MAKRQDWLIGGDRRTEAVERIFAAAAQLVSQQGFDAFTIEALSTKAHCSPATIYRHVGGKAVINGNPCIGRFASFVVVCHMCSPSIVKRANAIRILPGLEHLELFQKLIDGFASRVRNGTSLLQGY